MKSIRRNLVMNLKNIPGWRTPRKLVVFISDDWGDLRIESEENYEQLLAGGIPVENSVHTKYEALANAEDLEMLFSVLSSFKDSKGKPAVFTPFTIMANPDFEKIRDSGYQNYTAIPFVKRLKTTEEGKKTWRAWQDGIQRGVFNPEYHGRDHLNVPVWMKALRKGDEKLHFCYNNHYAYYRTEDMSINPVYAFYFETEKDFLFLERSLMQGVDLFQDAFGRKPVVFSPPNGMFNRRFYPSLVEKKIKAISAAHRRIEPDGKGGTVTGKCSFGEESPEGLLHYISNCAFEPVKEEYTGPEITLKQIAAAFRWGKPALINTHRVNYIGSRNPDVRAKGLEELNKLLAEIRRVWPDSEFISAGEFANYMNSSIKAEAK